jgi:hypothetical protein
VTTWLKVLSKDNRACHGGRFDFTPHLPAGDEPGVALPTRRAALCRSGWHWCSPESLWRTWAKPQMQVFEAQPSDDVSAFDSDGKCVSSSGQLLRSYPLPDCWTNAMRFVTEEIAAVPWFQPQGEPDPAWQIFRADTLAAARAAARAAAWDAAGDAAWAAARAAAWAAAWAAARAAAWAAARAAAGDAARAAAWDAAWDTLAAARDAAWDADWAAAWDAAGDAHLAAYYAICADLPIDQVHRDHVAARWNVWQQGYGLIGDANGVLFVYGQNP